MAKAPHERVVRPQDFSKALQAAGLIENSDNITEITVRATPNSLVTIEVTYLADERIYGLVAPDG